MRCQVHFCEKEIANTEGNGYTIRGGNYVKLFLVLSEKISTLKGKNVLFNPCHAE